MKTIPLTQGKVAVVDDEDYVALSIWTWRALRCRQNGHDIWYAVRTVYGTHLVVLMHREIAAVVGIPQVDHRDGDGLNNRRENLRPATSSQNSLNRRKRIRCSSRFKGVCWHEASDKWQAYIRADGRQLCLGLFEHEEDAARAYDRAARRFFGEFALTNFDESGLRRASSVFTKETAP